MLDSDQLCLTLDEAERQVFNLFADFYRACQSRQPKFTSCLDPGHYGSQLDSSLTLDRGIKDLKDGKFYSKLAPKSEPHVCLVI